MSGPRIVCVGCGVVTNNLFAQLCDQCAATVFDADARAFAGKACALHPGDCTNGTGFHRPNIDGTCSDCDAALGETP